MPATNRSAQYVRRAMRKLGLSQTGLANAIGYKQPWVSRILAGQYELSAPVRTIIEQKLAAKEAVQLIYHAEVEQPDCIGEKPVRDMTAEEYVEHLPFCPSCLLVSYDGKISMS